MLVSRGKQCLPVRASPVATGPVAASPVAIGWHRVAGGGPGRRVFRAARNAQGTCGGRDHSTGAAGATGDGQAPETARAAEDRPTRVPPDLSPVCQAPPNRQPRRSLRPLGRAAAPMRGPDVRPRCATMPVHAGPCIALPGRLVRGLSPQSPAPLQPQAGSFCLAVGGGDNGKNGDNRRAGVRAGPWPSAGR